MHRLRPLAFALTPLLCAACDDSHPLPPLPPEPPAAILGDPRLPTPYGPGGSGAPSCSSSKHRAFDFWLGDWRVDVPSGQQVGTDQVVSAVRGCALVETWVDAAGLEGRSLSSYDQTTDRWRQMWVDAGNSTLLLEGGAEGPGAMKLRQNRPAGFGQPLREDVITWHTTNGGVRQLWDASFDSGATFVNLFDGRYTHAMIAPVPRVRFAQCDNPARPRFFDFDFTLGTWSVKAVAPRKSGVLGTATIRRELFGCLLEEHFAGAGENSRYESIGFGSFDFAVRQWHREYADSRGARMVLTAGSSVAGAMVLTGNRGEGTRARFVRVSWSPVSADEFVQTWEVSTDSVAWATERKFAFKRLR